MLHAGILHLLVNMAYLWLFGCLVEDVLGRLEYLLFYAGSGIAGGLLRVAIVKYLLPAGADLPAVGASGAVAGILGVFAIRFYRARVKTLVMVPVQLPAVPAIGVWVGSQIAYAVLSIFLRAEPGAVVEKSLAVYASTGCWAHLGGFGFGLLSGWLMRLGRDADKEYLFTDARRDREAQNLNRALGPLRALLMQNPRDPQVHLELARVFQQMGHTDTAGAHACDALRFALRAGDMVQALSLYTALLPLGLLSGLPLDAEYRIACALESHQRLEAAAQAYKNVFQHYPEAMEAETALIRCAQVLARIPDHAEEAACLYREYLERYPDGRWRSMAEKPRF